MKKKNIKKIIGVRSAKGVRAFLSEEDGRITKKNIQKIALFLVVAGVAATGLMKADNSSATCAHASHGSHGSHSSHGSHGSHCSGGWCP